MSDPSFVGSHLKNIMVSTGYMYGTSYSDSQLIDLSSSTSSYCLKNNGSAYSTWKLDNDGILSNLAGVTLTGHWKLPAEGEIGTIQNTDTGTALSSNVDIIDGDTGKATASSGVVEEIQIETGETDSPYGNFNRKWYRSYVDGSGYFTLVHSSTYFLTYISNPSNTFTVEGMLLFKLS